jgi:hypothetical protein
MYLEYLGFYCTGYSAEVRLYDRLFIDEAPDSHKKNLDFMNPNSSDYTM